jgi:putative phosphonate metabolism protein
MPAEARYAIYFAPPADSPLGRAGAAWLGRDAASGAPLEQPPCPGLTPARLAELTAAPRRYGFHATLKPPFRLREGCTPEALERAVAALAARQRRCFFTLRLATLSGFFAWRPAEAHDEIAAIASACVTELEDFRAPPDELELARRRRGLNPNQAALLQRWGYPYVLDEFRFHLTLSDTVAGHEAEAMRTALEAWTQRHAQGAVAFDALCLFVEPSPGADFRLIARYAFDGGVTRHA